jgi:hypothetical protein
VAIIDRSTFLVTMVEGNGFLRLSSEAIHRRIDAVYGNAGI